MKRAIDIDEDATSVQKLHKKSDDSKSQFIVLPFIVPLSIFKMLNEEAMRLGITVANLMTLSLQEKMERLKKENGNGSL